jgi:general secretion pathway protein G
MQAKRGFTLVEILIVVVILGILAAIVIPQFTQASTEAKSNSLASDLQSLRSQIELYKVQHNDTAPAAATFITQMTQSSNISGVPSGSKQRNPGGPLDGMDYGPYLERVPINPFNDKKDGVDPTQGSILDLAGAAKNNPGSDAASWQYNATTGEIWADNSGATPQGTNYADF